MYLYMLDICVLYEQFFRERAEAEQGIIVE